MSWGSSIFSQAPFGGRRREAGQAGCSVSPELVQVSTAAARWQAPFEAPLTDVFQVQGQIAGRVAEALGVALGAGERERFSERPTQNLAAYDAFLRGEEAAGGNTSLDPVALRRARDYYEQAVGLDSSFALAWAQLSRAYSLLYLSAPNHRSGGGGSPGRRAFAGARAQAPGRSSGPRHTTTKRCGTTHHARSSSTRRGGSSRRRTPGSWPWPGGLSSFSGGSRRDLRHMREAEVLDPRSVDIAQSLTWPLLSRRRYAEALATAERARALAPSNLLVIVNVVWAHLAQGDLAGARGVLGAVPGEVDPAALVAQVAMDDLYWVLDDAQQRLLLRISPEPFGGDRAAWGLALAETHALRGDSGPGARLRRLRSPCS